MDEPEAIYIPITEEYCQKALDEYPEVHPGWKFFFTRTRELADELRIKEARAMKNSPMKIEGKTPYLDRAA